MPLRSPHYNWNETIPTSWGEGIESVGVTYYDDAITSLLSSSGDQFKFPWADAMDTHSYSTLYPSAASKQNVFNSVLSDYSEKEWVTKPVKQWTCQDVINWAFHVIDEQEQCDYERFQVDQFRVEGVTLCSWSERDFLERDGEFGYVLYSALEVLKGDEHKSAYERLYDDKSEFKHLPSFNDIRFGDRLSPTLGDSVSTTLTELKVARDPLHFTDSESDQSDYFMPIKKEESSRDQNLVKKKRGRPVGNRSKRKPEKKCGRLWEFIRDLLLKPEYCPSLICWENHDEGVFRFVRSDKVAELWGTIKDNPKMTYEKLSRAMRYYYKSKVLQPVFGRRLVYKFGPTAKGWRTDNPNFRLPVPCE